MRRAAFHLGILLLIFSAACNALTIPTATPTNTSLPPATSTPVMASCDTYALWSGGPHLRGANIYQRRVYPEIDGVTFLGPGPVGPPYTQQDFDRLADLGAEWLIRQRGRPHRAVITRKALTYLPSSLQTRMAGV